MKYVKLTSTADTSNNQFIRDALRTESLVNNQIDPRIDHAVTGLVTESAEMADAIKKSKFYGKELDLTNIKEESGDILWYLALLFDAIGTTFEAEQDRVISKLKVRYPEKFSKSGAMERDLKSEREVLERVYGA